MTYDPDDDQHQQDKDDRAQGFDRDPEPPDEDGEPIDLEECLDELGSDSGNEPIDQVIRMFRQARQELAYWRSLPLRVEYVATYGQDPEQVAHPIPCPDGADALRVAGQEEDGKAWVRSLTVHPWQELSDSPPF